VFGMLWPAPPWSFALEPCQTGPYSQENDLEFGSYKEKLEHRKSMLTTKIKPTIKCVRASKGANLDSTVSSLCQ
jgi:hypothetical protein